jgi:PAS domain S-box-containing protein
MMTDPRHCTAIVESSDDAIISKDLNGLVTTWNPGAERLFGISPAEMVGTSIMRIIPPDRHDEETHILAEIRAGRRVKHFETVRLGRGGRRIDVSITASPIRDADGKVIGVSKVARDISERKRAEAEVRRQQAMLLTERELTLDAILVVDDQSKVLSYNRRFAQMWGLSDDILETRADEQLLRAISEKLAYPEQFMERVRQLYDRHDEASNDEVELVDRRVLERYSAPMRDGGAGYYGRVWYFRDVTERKRSERALRLERDKAQRYLDTAEVILLALDVQGRVTSINRKGRDILGWSESELVGRSWIETCLPPRIREELSRKFDALTNGDISTVENPIQTKGGEERLIEWRSRVLCDDAGRVIGTLSSGADITERHAAVEALRITEERMRFALTNAGVGIWDMDYTTGAARMSEILEGLYGLDPGTFGGTLEDFIERVYPEDRPALLETLEKATRSGEDFATLYRIVRPDGTMRWLSNAGRVQLDENHEPVRGVGISMDVTERRTLEEQYHQAQKMEAVGRLAGGVAHDFNNLLTAILGYCELLLADLDPHDARRADINEIHSAGESGARLTRQLLTFSRKQIIEPRPLDLNNVVTSVRGLLARLIGEDVKIVVNISPDLAPVTADPGQIEQIVLNLALNARDAMPSGGTLKIETANVDFDQHYTNRHFSVKAGSYVVLTVTDTGIGMTPEVQARLFEPFFTTKELGKGTGLGLATVHGIVMRCGGSVGVFSEVGRGTSFKVYLPRGGTSYGTDEASPAVAKFNAAGETVLVVEDADGLGYLTKRMLEPRGYKVLLSSNADEAIRQFDQTPSIDVILTDVIMPGSSGPELARQLMGRRADLKVLYMSGYTEDAITHHGVLDPGIAFIHKPFTAETLSRKIREVLDR